MLRHIHHKTMMEGISNIEVIKADADNPQVPAGVDLAFICDVLHHVKNREAWIAALSSQLRPSVRLVLIEFREGDLPEGPPEKIKIPKSRLISLFLKHGFTLDADISAMLPYQGFLVFHRN